MNGETSEPIFKSSFGHEICKPHFLSMELVVPIEINKHKLGSPFYTEDSEMLVNWELALITTKQANFFFSCFQSSYLLLAFLQCYVLNTLEISQKCHE